MIWTNDLVQMSSTSISILYSSPLAVAFTESCEHVYDNAWTSYKSYKYCIGAQSITFPDAQSECESMGANLTSVENQEEQNFLNGGFFLKVWELIRYRVSPITIIILCILIVFVLPNITIVWVEQ